MRKNRTEPYLASYLHAKGRALGLPIGGNFELTPRCNFNCPMCYVHMSQEDAQAQGKELTAQQWITLAESAKEKGMMFVLLTGGEPFVRKDFFEIYGAMKEMGLLVSINSNGSMLTGEIRRKLLENPPMRMNISLYGGCRQTYQDMCGQDMFNQVVDNIRALKDGGIDVRLNLSITPYNRQDLSKIYAISQELGLHVKATSYMYPPVRVNGQQFGVGDRLTPEEAARCAVEWDQLRFSPEEFAVRAAGMRQLTLEKQHECMDEQGESLSCRAGVTSFWMTWDGRMLPCGMMPAPETYPLEVGFDAAWDALRASTAQLRMPAKCTACPSRKACSVCAAVCVTETGKFDQAPEYVCQMTEATIAGMEMAAQERK